MGRLPRASLSPGVPHTHTYSQGSSERQGHAASSLRGTGILWSPPALLPPVRADSAAVHSDPTCSASPLRLQGASWCDCLSISQASQLACSGPGTGTQTVNSRT